MIYRTNEKRRTNEKLFHYNKYSKQCPLIKIMFSTDIIFGKPLKVTDKKLFTQKKKKKENGDILDISDFGFQVCIENDVNIQ